MADNQYVNKVVNGESGATLIDLTSDTAVASDVAQGKYFHLASGERVQGTASGGGGGGGAVIQDQDGYLVLSDQGGGSSVQVDPLSVTQNGTYTAQSGHAYSPVTVNVSGGGGGDSSYKNLVERTGTTITLPSGLTTVGDYACQNYSTLEQIAIPHGVTRIGDNAFSMCTHLSTVTLPSTLTAIGQNAFFRCSSLTEVSCEGVITVIGGGAFACATATPSTLERASFPYTVMQRLNTSFGSTTASAACKLLEFLDIGSTQEIIANALANCNSLQTLVLRRSDAICSLANVSAFTNTPMSGYGGSTGTIYVPNALISTYQSATNWKTLYDGGTCTFVKIEGSAYEL